ncbi:MAG: hemolysin family protein [Oligoflexia bacterium]|nr:hemolysin family protein [Oligoflexia bacterium]
MEPPGTVLTLFFITLSLVLVALNAFFVAAEFAIVKVRRSRLEELAGQGVAAARISILCVDQLDEYLSATQLGITLVSLGLGWIGEEAFFNLLSILFPAYLPDGNAYLHALATGISFFIITLLHVVLGELVPKSMAIQRAEEVTLRISKPLQWFYRIARPLIQAFTSIANFVLRRLGYHGLEEPPLSEDELKIVLRESHEDGVISESEAQIINRAFEFSDKRASQIMIPAEKVEYLSLQRSFEENMVAARRRMHTRFPLTRDGLDSVIGIVHMKDVLHVISEGEAEADFAKIARPPLFIDPGMRQDQILRLLKERRVHMAIIQDPKSGKILGVVTMEDVLEELVGDILDEHGN